MKCPPLYVCMNCSQRKLDLTGIRCFLSPREWFSLEPSSCCCSVLRPNGYCELFSPLEVQQLWLNLQTEKVFCRHLYGCFCWLSQIFSAKEPHDQTKATRRTMKNLIALVESERARNSLIFRCWCKHETPWCKRLNLK